uniref:Uncharacterized protein n=1 Tax=Tanacetum cinerariifolium TaxID=118510 RepID=A0A6L2LRN5_TANCI|nr:hypothetical protein [Tanacetum cinerariifolium]
MANEPMAVLAIEEITEPVAEAEEEQVVTPVVDMKHEQMAAPVIDTDEDLAVLFGEDDDFEDDDFSDDDSEGVKKEKVWEVNEEWLMAPVTPLLVPAMQPPSYSSGQLGVQTWAASEESDTSSGDDVPDGSCGRLMGAGVGLGFTGRGAAEKHSDSTPTDYGLRHEQP